MSFWDRFRGSSSPVVAARTTGVPTSSNGASSMHVRWLDVPKGALAVTVDLTVAEPPTGKSLHFWALQASFMDGDVSRGAGHLGLQWMEGYPGNTAVNWGGYRDGGGELDGSASTLPSQRGNVNTRNYQWLERRTYTLRISRGSNGWLGSVIDSESGTTTHVRELYCPGAELGNVVMWSEVFAPCEGPTTSVQWTNPRVETPGGIAVVQRVQLSYQSVADGGCSNTNTSPLAAGSGVEQSTATTRVQPHGAILDI